ncbi:WRKY domain [Sesbania bispinosa]|nr:WRKY domain [Sesbania bispinosa]
MEEELRIKAIEELVRGREIANHLRQVMISSENDESITQHLVNNMLRSFTNTLFLLDKFESQEVSQIHQQRDSSSKSEDSQESYCKSSSTSTAGKDRRGCYKRRKTTQTWEKVTEIPVDDCHQWRKYGQKEILNNKYPRNYYRCTHKFDQRCQATKQVQRIQEEPPLYKTTYYGHHTCKNLLNPEIILDPTSPPNTILLSFNNTFPTPTKQECPFLSSSFPSPPPPPVNKECKEEPPSSSLDDYLLPPQPTLDDSSRHNVTLESDHSWDVMSGVMLYDSVELDDVFQPFVGFW